jgi:hypothetical protein
MNGWYGRPYKTRRELGDFRSKGNDWRREHYRPGYKPRLTIAGAHEAVEAMLWGEGQCDYCGELIVRWRTTKRYCSGACRVAAHRARKVAGASGRDFVGTVAVPSTVRAVPACGRATRTSGGA